MSAVILILAVFAYSGLYYGCCAQNQQLSVFRRPLLSLFPRENRVNPRNSPENPVVRPGQQLPRHPIQQVSRVDPWARRDQSSVWSNRPISRSYPVWRSCQRTGCPSQGSHCVFLGGFCPQLVRGTPCRCEPGCRVDTHFIPHGQSRVIDECGNICRCNSRTGQATCTTRRC